MTINSAMKREKRRKSRRKKRILIVLLLIFLFIVGFCVGSFFYVFGSLTTTDLPTDNASLGVSEETQDYSAQSGVTNIALFGVDARDDSDSGRSDAIMVMSVNGDSGEIKMISLLRDSKVSIEGHGETKLNHAYSYGGPSLAIKTINQNFDLDIKEYVTVNFSQLADIVDAVDGVNITLTPAEVESANSNIRMDAPDCPDITGSGELLLNGDQAVAYARIRNIDSDNARADRQKVVLSAILMKVKEMPKSSYPGFIRDFLSIVETSLSYGDLFSLSPIMLKGDLNIEQYNVPDENDNPWGGIDSDGVWYWIYDLDAAAQRIHNIIYE